jgi:hypothetical protein
MSKPSPEERATLAAALPKIYREVKMPDGDTIMRETLEAAAPALIKLEEIEMESERRAHEIFVGPGSRGACEHDN